MYKNFNQDKYIFEKNNNIDFLLIKFEELNEWKNIFFKIFKLNIELIDKNKSDEKEYYELYKKTLNNTLNKHNQKIFENTLHYKYFYKNNY